MEQQQPKETKEELKRRIDKISWRDLDWLKGDTQISRELNIPYKIVRRRRYMFTRIRVRTRGKEPAKKPDNFKPVFRRGGQTTYELTRSRYGADIPISAMKKWIREFNDESRTYYPMMLKLCEHMISTARSLRDNGSITCSVSDLFNKFNKYTGPLSGIRIQVVNRMEFLLIEELNTTQSNRSDIDIHNLVCYDAIIGNNIEIVIKDLAIIRKRYVKKLK